MRHNYRQDIIIAVVFGICCLLMCLIPSPSTGTTTEAQRIRAKVVEVDNKDVAMHGYVKFGSQRLKVKLLQGKHKGETIQAANELRAQLELDKEFAVGDKVIVLLPLDDDAEISVVVAQDYDRTLWSYVLIILFCALLCVFGGWTGLKALFSFYLSCLVIWKAVIPLTLRGWPASWTIFAAVCFLTAAIIFLVAGLTKKGWAAFFGAMAGVLAGLCMAGLFTHLLRINGAVMPYSQTLLFSGYSTINLADLFAGAMILASSGAVMDLAMDIAAGVGEVAYHSPDLPARMLIASGMRIGKSVVGTMTTTLLLAYSGGYITLMMMFASQGNPINEILNNPLVASEAVKTLIGSFSLILVAPFTAVFAGIIFAKRPNSP